MAGGYTCTRCVRGQGGLGGRELDDGHHHKLQPDRHSARVWGRPERRAALVWIKAVVELVEVRMAAGKRSSPGGTGSAHVSHSLVVSTR